MNLKDKKCLIAYFSRKGNNYVSGRIVDLPIGNTEVVAKMIQEMTGSDMFHIEAVKPYPKDYTETTKVAQDELRANARPELTNHTANMDSYDVIFLGYPNWWGTMPTPVFTFLEEYDFSGKTIVPFCTHEGSGLGHSEKDIAKLCPKATVLNGLAIHGSRVNAAKKDVTNWLNKIGIIS
ncbi:MAG: flavodoxin [Clostridiales bacterium]|jgi:flavodoxin|nr:flavodoxin [Eubacteriales bacterium]MDH7565473.1 flavodoxin [Clostridiales bacterium]